MGSQWDVLPSLTDLQGDSGDLQHSLRLFVQDGTWWIQFSLTSLYAIGVSSEIALRMHYAPEGASSDVPMLAQDTYSVRHYS